MRVLVTFESSAFNTTVQKEYFKRPGVYGDDVASWVRQEMGKRGHWANPNFVQEQFGWALEFLANGKFHYLLIAWRPDAPGSAKGSWVCWVERKRMFLLYMFKMNRRGIQPKALALVHEILSSSPTVRNIKWFDWDMGRPAAPTPDQ